MEALLICCNRVSLPVALTLELLAVPIVYHSHAHSMVDSMEIAMFAAELNMVVEHVDNMDICHNPLELFAQVMFHQLSLVECRLKRKNYWIGHDFLEQKSF